MADWDLERALQLELQLAVSRTKYRRVATEARQLVDEVLGTHSNADPETAAKRLRVVLRELENTAANLH